ncbi:hypothetical protein NMY22_g1247 [Coprinellus aureogranulatus]|nr:hypothetical protein NMY22_g1247 [Coprinellus aureogranulatus]
MSEPTTDLTSMAPLAVEERLMILPIRHASLWKMYQRARDSFWLPREIRLHEDVSQWATILTQTEKHLLSRILAFFATADGIVADNIVERFTQETEIMEAKFFYGFQAMMENIHAKTYAMLIQNLIPDERQRHDILRASFAIPSVADKNEWAKRWLRRETSSFAERLIAFACVEGIFFQSSFAVIFWFKRQGKMPGLADSNDLISRDEALHTEFACLMLKRLDDRPTEEVATKIVREAVNIEKRFVEGIPDALSQPLPGLPKDSMIKYVEYVGDQLLRSMGYGPFFRTQNLFLFMNMTSMPAHTNFFERKNVEYRLAGNNFESVANQEFSNDAFD